MNDTSSSSMNVIRFRWRQTAFFISAIVALFLYNEWLVYYFVLLQCQWPTLNVETNDFTVNYDDGTVNSPLRVMVLADTHLLGIREGHWFDKLRREWQMERSFQAAMSLHDPEVVFVLGDLFDEGKWCSDSEFQHHVSRFHRMFHTPSTTQLYAVVGNHDIGFHYMVSDHQRQRFTNAFSSPSVRLIRVKGNMFVLVNSMAFEGDGCNMCLDADARLQQISKSLRCAQGTSRHCSELTEKFRYTKPIIVQHFPMYRVSDSVCTGPDAAATQVRDVPLKPRWDCLSKEASDELIARLEPRLILDAHTHNFCQTQYNGTPEWTIASFSWRNRNNPSFILVAVTNSNFAITKCFLPQESTVIYTYIVGVILIVLWFLFPRKLLTYSRSAKCS